MRARNREINIFNMSLLDILTGMLGAFLFLMLALLPYYAKVSKQKPEDVQALKQENQQLRDQVQLQQQQIADLQKQLDELQKIVKQSAGGPMTADQIQQLMDQLNQARQQLDQLRAQVQQGQSQTQQLQAQNDQMQQQLQQMKQDLQDTTKDRDYWKSQQGTVGLLTNWDSPNVDIDVMVRDPDGRIYTPKYQDKILGTETIFDGDDSHATPAKPYAHEGLMVFMQKSGEYLVFYRVPKDAKPADYVSLRGQVIYSEIIGKGKGGSIREDSLGSSRAYMAPPGGLYAWAIITYDAQKYNILVRPADGKMPDGIVIPHETPAPVQTPPPVATPRTTPPHFPFGSVGHPLVPARPGASITPTALPSTTPHP